MIVGEAFVALRPDHKGFGPAAERGILGPVTSIAKRATAILGTALAGRALFQLGRDAFGEAEEAIKIGRQTDAALRSTKGAAKVTAAEIERLADATSRKIGVDDDLIQQNANLLLTFTKVRNEAGKGNDVFNQAVGLGQDMAAALGTDARGGMIQLGKALNDPIKGVAALTRVGVTFTAQQKDQIKALVESGDQLGAQKIILRELATEFGGSAAAQATAADRLRVTWGNVKEELGNRLMPALNVAADFLSDNLPRAFDAADARISPVVDTISGAVERIGSAVEAYQSALSGEGITTSAEKLEGIAERIGVALGAVRDGFNNGAGDTDGWVRNFKVLGEKTDELAEAMGRAADEADRWHEEMGPLNEALERHRDILIPLAGAVGAFVGTLVVLSKVAAIATAVRTAFAVLGTVVAALGGGAAILVGAIAALVAGLVLAYFHVEPFRKAVDKAARLIRDVAVAAFEQLVEWVGAAADALSGLGDDVGDVVGDVGDALGKVPDLVRRYLFDPLVPFAEWVDEHVGATLEAAGEFFAALGARAADTFRILQAVLTPIVTFIAETIIGRLQRAAEFVIATLADLLNIAITWAEAIGAQLAIPFDLMRAAVETVFGIVVAFVEMALQNLRGIFQVGTGLLTGDWGKAWEGIKNIVTAPLEFIATSVTTAIDNLVEFFGKVPGRIADAAEGMWDAIWETFKGVINLVIRGWNSLEFKIPGFNPPGPGPKFKGFTLGVPDIPELKHGGGVVGGGSGDEALVQALRGELMFRDPAQFRRVAAAVAPAATVQVGPNYNVEMDPLLVEQAVSFSLVEGMVTAP